jgi:hypothetical protein
MEMMPITFAAEKKLTPADGLNVTRDRSERRHVSRSASHVGHYPSIAAQPLSRLEA